MGQLALREVVIKATPWTEVGALSLEQVYRAHPSTVYRFCPSLVRDPTQAEDVAAEVFVSALSAFERTRPGAYEVRPQLLGVAHNEVIDRERRRKRRSLLLARFFSHGSEADPDANVEAPALPRNNHCTALLDAIDYDRYQVNNYAA